MKTTFDWKHWLDPVPPAQKNLRALATGSEVAVYGTGTVARDVIGLLKKRGLKIRCVIDANTTRTEVDGLSVKRPDDPAMLLKERPAIPLVIGIFNCEVDIDALTQKLAGWGWTWVIDFTELHALWPDLLGDRYWLTRRDFYGSHAHEIAAADALWADEASRELYRQLFRFRVTGDRSGLPHPPHESQYFPPDLPGWKTPLRLIDCGAFDGDTLRQVDASKLPLEAIAAFEPDPGNYTKLVTTIEKMKENRIFEATARPCGVWSETTQLRFEGARGGGSALSQSGDLVIECVALDEALPSFAPTLIKMDIEGAEVAALHGARELIRKNRPGLAVCLYHCPDHLWKIPLLLHEWDPGYRFYLRVHCFNGFDVVLYALPPD